MEYNHFQFANNNINTHKDINMQQIPINSNNLIEVKNNMNAFESTDNNGGRARFHRNRNSRREGSASRVLFELQRDFAEINFDENSPNFEFHGHGCVENQPFLNMNLTNQSGFTDSGKLHNVTRQLFNQHENVNENQENLIAQNVDTTIPRDNGDHDVIMRLMNLINSIYEQLNAELPSSQINALPSDYTYDWPKKTNKPRGLNIRHHIHLLIVKLDRFLAKLGRILESNKNFDFVKYTECDKFLKGALSYLDAIRPFDDIDIQHRNGQILDNGTLANAQHLESLLIGLREWTRGAHLNVHVFNWEMDGEHRSSYAMAQTRDETNKRAMQQVELEKLTAAQQPQRTPEEQLLVEKYHIDPLLKCASDHNDFLTELLNSPETYFPPEILDMCTLRNSDNAVQELHLDDWVISHEPMDFRDILDAPSSPPRVNHRNYNPKKFIGQI